MADEPQLPKLPSYVATESTSYNRPHKRVRLSSPSVISSDPPVFSSDDDPSAENYTRERRKRKYRGPWFHQKPASAGIDEQQIGRGKRKFERQFDSGVFMGSDGTEMSDVVEDVESGPGIWPEGLSQTSAPMMSQLSISPEEERAQELIQGYLEDGIENIDLSGQNITSLSNATIRPLASFTRIQPVAKGVFTRLDPQLKLFLHKNRLVTLPSELFALDRLTALSLRDNCIKELPLNIGQLSKLREINLAQNNLRFLPFEILDLFLDTARLDRLLLHPNPFCEPEYSKDEQIEAPAAQYKIGLGRRESSQPKRSSDCFVSPRQARPWHRKWHIIYQARSEVNFIDIIGRIVKGSSLSATDPDVSLSIPVAQDGDIPSPPHSGGNLISRAPSLLEVALNSCMKTSQLPCLSSYLPEDSPPYLSTLLAKATEKKESGGSKCTICNRNFIIARTEWIEWWEFTKRTVPTNMSAASPLRQMENERDVVESRVPLIRRGCSWLCVPEKAMLTKDNVVIQDTDTVIFSDM